MRNLYPSRLRLTRNTFIYYLLGVHYPHRISNAALYARCNTEPLRFRLVCARWRLFGHILRRPASIPAYRAMVMYFSPAVGDAWRGRPMHTLPQVLHTDLQAAPSHYQLKSVSDLEDLRALAQDRHGWKELTESIVAACPVAPAPAA